MEHYMGGQKPDLEYEESLDVLGERILDADTVLRKNSPGVRCQFGFTCLSGKEYTVGFGPLRVGQELLWVAWANDSFEKNEKRFPIRGLPARVKIDLVSSSVYEAIEQRLGVAKAHMATRAKQAADKLDSFCED